MTDNWKLLIAIFRLILILIALVLTGVSITSRQVQQSQDDNVFVSFVAVGFADGRKKTISEALEDTCQRFVSGFTAAFGFTIVAIIFLVFMMMFTVGNGIIYEHYLNLERDRIVQAFRKHLRENFVAKRRAIRQKAEEAWYRQWVADILPHREAYERKRAGMSDAERKKADAELMAVRKKETDAAVDKVLPYPFLPVFLEGADVYDAAATEMMEAHHRATVANRNPNHHGNNNAASPASNPNGNGNGSKPHAPDFHANSTNNNNDADELTDIGSGNSLNGAGGANGGGAAASARRRRGSGPYGRYDDGEDEPCCPRCCCVCCSCCTVTCCLAFVGHRATKMIYFSFTFFALFFATIPWGMTADYYNNGWCNGMSPTEHHYEYGMGFGVAVASWCLQLVILGIYFLEGSAETGTKLSWIAEIDKEKRAEYDGTGAVGVMSEVVTATSPTANGRGGAPNNTVATSNADGSPSSGGGSGGASSSNSPPDGSDTRYAIDGPMPAAERQRLQQQMLQQQHPHHHGFDDGLTGGGQPITSVASVSSGSGRAGAGFRLRMPPPPPRTREWLVLPPRGTPFDLNPPLPSRNNTNGGAANPYHSRSPTTHSGAGGGGSGNGGSGRFTSSTSMSSPALHPNNNLDPHRRANYVNNNNNNVHAHQYEYAPHQYRRDDADDDDDDTANSSVTGYDSSAFTRGGLPSSRSNRQRRSSIVTGSGSPLYDNHHGNNSNNRRHQNLNGSGGGGGGADANHYSLAHQSFDQQQHHHSREPYGDGVNYNNHHHNQLPMAVPSSGTFGSNYSAAARTTGVAGPAANANAAAIDGSAVIDDDDELDYEAIVDEDEEERYCNNNKKNNNNTAATVVGGGVPMGRPHGATAGAPDADENTATNDDTATATSDCNYVAQSSSATINS